MFCHQVLCVWRGSLFCQIEPSVFCVIKPFLQISQIRLFMVDKSFISNSVNSMSSLALSSGDSIVTLKIGIDFLPVSFTVVTSLVLNPFGFSFKAINAYLEIESLLYPLSKNSQKIFPRIFTGHIGGSDSSTTDVNPVDTVPFKSLRFSHRLLWCFHLQKITPYTLTFISPVALLDTIKT